MLNRISRYWWCQSIGWFSFIAISVFFVTTFDKLTQVYVLSLVCTCVVGIIVTHIMRYNISYLRVLEKPLKKQIVYFLIITIVFSIVLGMLSEVVDQLIGYNPKRQQEFSKAERLFLSTYNALWLVLIWNMIYYIYHYIESNRRQQIDRLRLQAMVKSLELNTIKSHINPHFIFNALNSIRALVDENPSRARTAITELSNILRSSMQAEKMETVPLMQELDIVKDYLALEHMRFEDRLKIEINVDEDTLTQPVPPMMLQTLVENAIKHGISKHIKGGVVRIISTFNDNQHQLIVQNSGKLNGSFTSGEGFGLKSTQERLKLLYQGKASFQIYETPQGMVESKILMPANNN